MLTPSTIIFLSLSLISTTWATSSLSKSYTLSLYSLTCQNIPPSSEINLSISSNAGQFNWTNLTESPGNFLTDIILFKPEIVYQGEKPSKSSNQLIEDEIYRVTIDTKNDDKNTMRIDAYKGSWEYKTLSLQNTTLFPFYAINQTFAPGALQNITIPSPGYYCLATRHHYATEINDTYARQWLDQYNNHYEEDPDRDPVMFYESMIASVFYPTVNIPGDGVNLRFEEYVQYLRYRGIVILMFVLPIWLLCCRLIVFVKDVEILCVAHDQLNHLFPYFGFFIWRISTDLIIVGFNVKKRKDFDLMMMFSTFNILSFIALIYISTLIHVSLMVQYSPDLSTSVSYIHAPISVLPIIKLIARDVPYMVFVYFSEAQLLSPMVFNGEMKWFFWNIVSTAILIVACLPVWVWFVHRYNEVVCGGDDDGELFDRDQVRKSAKLLNFIYRVVMTGFVSFYGLSIVWLVLVIRFTIKEDISYMMNYLYNPGGFFWATIDLYWYGLVLWSCMIFTLPQLRKLE